MRVPTKPDREYWEQVHRTWKAARLDELWRRHSDAVDVAWLRAWLPQTGVASMLKTDHYEVASDIASSIVEARRVLRSSGHLLISLDNLANPLVALRNVLPMAMLQRLRLVPYFVGASYGPRRLRRVLQQSGFEVEATSAIVNYPRWLAVAVCRIAEARLRATAAQERWLHLLDGFEQLSRLPTRYLTGHLIVARAQGAGVM